MAALGRSKAKRSDCARLTLALVRDARGFPTRSDIFAGNVSELGTLETMIRALDPKSAAHAPTVVLDAGIATEDNIAWLVDNHSPYGVVSRRRQRQFDPEAVLLIKEQGDTTIGAQRALGEDGEGYLSCHWSQRENQRARHCPAIRSTLRSSSG